jgi:hypothetical protein
MARTAVERGRGGDYLPVKVLGSANGDETVTICEHGEYSHLIVVFELSA